VLHPRLAASRAQQAEQLRHRWVWQALRLLQTWHPLVAYGQRFVQEVDPYKKALIVAEASEWVASKTDATLDDQAVKLLADLLRTKEGEALVRWCLLQVEAIR
jgi:hypothetical protein